MRQNPNNPRLGPAKRLISWLLLLVLLLCSLFGAGSSRETARSLSQSRTSLFQEGPPLYLPSTAAVKVVTLGYQSFFSHVLWFTTLNYFGKQLAENRDFRWFGHMCKLTVDLDPKASHVYEFCASLLSWVARDSAASIQILDRAIAQFPESWRFYYLRGFTYWYFEEDKTKAREDLSFATTLPAAPRFVASLTARLLASEDGVDEAVEFLNELLQNTSEPQARKAIKKKLRLAKVRSDIQQLESAVKSYSTQYQSWPSSLEEVQSAGILASIPLDPWKTPYLYDPQTGAVRSKKGKAGLVFHGKTAETGLARFELGHNRKDKPELKIDGGLE